MTFADVISPVSVDEFKYKYFCKSYLRTSAVTGRFADMVPWEGLNDVISRLRIGSERIRVVRDGREISSDEYLTGSPRGGKARVNTRALERRLQLGDSLVINAVEELFKGVESIVESIEDIFQVTSGANLYAGFKRWKGFDLHFDDHDTLILQIHGKKAWRIHEPTKPCVVSMRRPQDVERPSGAPIWEGLLESGDVLYMPRGWWHVAEPVDGPSVHVTFAIVQPTGVELLAWVTEELREDVAARKPLPLFETRQDREAYARKLADSIARRLTDDVVGRYFTWRASRISLRRRINLPAAATENVQVPNSSAAPVVLIQSRRLTLLKLSDEEIGFVAAGKLWRCHAAMWPALEHLDYQIGWSSDELTQMLPPTFRAPFRLFMEALISAGVLVEDREYSVLPEPREAQHLE